ncbi:MAG TPA: erythromycin esterase family protein [Burkholderiales bacterium]|nr:erythromycin esterase family protein [Burkholderiales bacterium]
MEPHSHAVACALFALLALVPGAAAHGALPGVTELRTAPEKIADVVLDKLVGARVAAADVVALGETVHGSSGLLRAQARFIRYLVEKHGFRLIVWENPTLRSVELARWVDSCRKAKSPPPLDVLYMPTPSDAPLFEWICDFNLARPADAIVFRGMDIWDRPWAHYAIVKDAAALCPAYRSKSWKEVDEVTAQVQPNGTMFPASEYEACRAALAKVMDAARQSRDHELALSASTLLGWLGFHHDQWSDDVRSWNARDAAQARNLEIIMEKHAAKRAILSAHTSHVSHNRSRADWWGYGDLKSGVYFFEAATKRTVFNVAFTAYEASGTQGPWSLPTARNSMDRKLQEAGHAFAFVPADAPFLAEHPRWWMQNQNYPGPYESGVEIVPADHFDAFVFFGRSHLDRALPARPMWQP